MQYNNKIICPPKEHIFEALKLTSYANTKVVIPVVLRNDDKT